MDPITSILLAVAALFVWAYVTYVVVRSAVRDGLRDHVRLQREYADGDAGPSTADPSSTT
ncbi:hypothetical protein [Georgenia sp. Z1491]|uniref:hypothetical protein n=1 Tax=Georgenia sp. Z1491 TaxID=3416707 RepID=UPI003CEC6929